MTHQQDLNPLNRSSLIKWLGEVHHNFKLLPETMGLAVNIIDRFFSQYSVPKSMIQLIGTTSLFIAAKYEEIYPPECNDFVSISKYSKQDILDMEEKILNSLSFELTVPIPIYFLRRFSKVALSDYQTHTLSKYLLELSQIDFRMIKYLPSTIAASSVYVSRLMLNTKPLWNETLKFYTKYDENKLLACVKDLVNVIHDTHNKQFRFVVEKYSSTKFDQVALLPFPEKLMC